MSLTYNYSFQNYALTRTAVAMVNLTNAGDVGGDATVNWWIVNGTQNRIISLSETVFVGVHQTKQFLCTFDIDQGNYVFNAEVTKIANYPLDSPAKASLAFSVGYIYLDFLQEYYLPIILICVLITVIACVVAFKRRRRRRSTPRKTKTRSHRRRRRKKN